MLADELRAHPPDYPAGFARQIAEAQKFVIDPSLLTVVAATLTVAAIDDGAQFVRLPFPLTWIEYDFREDGEHRRVGALCRQVAGSAGAAFSMTFASRTSDAHQTEVMVRLLRVDLADPGVIHFQAEGLAGMPPPVFPSTPETVRTTDLILMGMARTMIGALMFLAARGGARSETVRPDERLQRARLKNDKPPLYSYARLRIDVGKPEREPGLAGPGGARSPVRGHTVRGHMMRCRKGLVWRRPHIRGDLSRGFVVKTYDLAGSPEATP